MSAVPIPDDPDKFIPTAEVARRLGLAVNTIIAMVDREELKPAFRAPGRRGAMFFDVETVTEVARARHKTLAAQAEAIAASAGLNPTKAKAS